MGNRFVLHVERYIKVNQQQQVFGLPVKVVNCQPFRDRIMTKIQKLVRKFKPKYFIVCCNPAYGSEEYLPPFLVEKLFTSVMYPGLKLIWSYSTFVKVLKRPGSFQKRAEIVLRNVGASIVDHKSFSKYRDAENLEDMSEEGLAVFLQDLKSHVAQLSAIELVNSELHGGHAEKESSTEQSSFNDSTVQAASHDHRDRADATPALEGPAPEAREAAEPGGESL